MTETTGPIVNASVRSGIVDTVDDVRGRFVANGKFAASTQRNH